MNGYLPFAIVVAVVAGVGLRRLGVRWSSALIVVVGIALYSYYLRHTPFDVRNFDSAAHLNYIRYLLEHRALPSETQCYVCHHPPGYHLLAAGAFALFQRAGWIEATKGLQAMSLVLFVVFVAFSTATIQRLATRPYQATLATALVVFWPYSIINSARLNNDIAIYAVSGVVMYLVVRWYQDLKTRWLLGAAALCVMGLLIKSSALSLVGILTLVVVVRVVRDSVQRGRLIRTAAPTVAVLLVVTALVSVVRGNHGSDAVRNTFGTAYVEKSRSLKTRTLSYYLTFDLGRLREPYAVVFPLQSREPTYWNHLAKSSLYGTRNLKREPAQLETRADVAVVLNYLLLGLFGFGALGLALGRGARGPVVTLCLAMALVFIASALSFHLLVPLGHHADFRFIYPSLVPLAVLYAQAVEAVRRRGTPLWHLGYMLANVVLALSVLSFFPSSHEAPAKAPTITRMRAPPKLTPLRPLAPRPAGSAQ